MATARTPQHAHVQGFVFILRTCAPELKRRACSNPAAENAGTAAQIVADNDIAA